MLFDRVRILASAIALAAASFVLAVASDARAIPASTLTNSGGPTTAYCCGVVVPIDPGVTVRSSTLTGATVSIETGFAPGEDVLALPAPIGSITGSYSSSTGVLTLSGMDTGANYQAALRSVTYQDTASVPSTSPRTITFGLGPLVAFSGTGHFYEFVPTSTDWVSAETAASMRTYLGLTGYLATITSAQENAFLLEKATGNGWIGAQTASFTFPRTWLWMTGPEAGESFFNNTAAAMGNTTGMDVPYANWSVSEPNSFGGMENCGEFYGTGGGVGEWNDLASTNIAGIGGYFCEYGGTAGDPVESLLSSKTVVFLDTTFVLTSAANPSEPGASVTFTATLAPLPTSGTVTFTSSDSTSLGGPVTISTSTGTASVTTSALTNGTDTITATASYVYAGNSLTASATLDQHVGVSCPAGEAACPTMSPTYCANEANDRNNCGGCGTVCPSGEVCVSGACQAQCLSGEVLCGSRCINPATDDAYCGAAAAGACNSASSSSPDYQGVTCSNGKLCSGGVCAATCAAGYTPCPNGGTPYCASVLLDSNNCGSCGNVCPLGEQCSGGACACAAATPTACGSGASAYCANLLRDENNCGQCGAVCSQGHVCDGTGACATSCVAGETNCSGLCTSTNTDNLNCGACGDACPSGEQCDGTGHCAVSCLAGETNCSGLCTSTKTDNLNCGGCGTVCPSGKVCDGTGHCATTCVAGETDCSGLCTSTNTDNLNCGACGDACPPGETCNGSGICDVSCIAGETNCAGVCTSTNSDSLNCGACGTACPPGETCNGSGVCNVSCIAGEANCAGVCTSTNADSLNCGACGAACPSGKLCDGTGQCATSCVAGATNCSGLCTSTNTDNLNCGACGTACPSGEQCDGTGQCTVSCVAGETNCSGLCTSTNTDDLNCGACGNRCPAGIVCLAGACAIAAGVDGGIVASSSPSQGGGGCSVGAGPRPTGGAGATLALFAIALVIRGRYAATAKRSRR